MTSTFAIQRSTTGGEINMTLNRDDEAAGGTRAGGDVVTKGPSQAPSDQSGGTRAGGDVVTKGSSQAPTDEQQSGGTRAGGDVVTKGPSQ